MARKKAKKPTKKAAKKPAASIYKAVKKRIKKRKPNITTGAALPARRSPVDRKPPSYEQQEESL